MIFLKKKKSLTSLNGLCFFTKYSLILLTQFFPMRTFISPREAGWLLPSAKARAGAYSLVLSFGFPLLAKRGIKLQIYNPSIHLCLFYPQAGRALPFCLETKRKQKVQGLISNKVFHLAKPKTSGWFNRYPPINFPLFLSLCRRSKLHSL